jgi:plastocyanin domain-containing protein
VSIEQWLVLISGIAAIVWVNWYFFFAERRAVDARPSAGGVQQVAIAVKGGYDPAVVRVKAKAPIRLVFDRQETSSCSEEVVFPDFGVRRFLPAFHKTTVELSPAEPGRYAFTCGMSMLRGTLVVE